MKKILEMSLTILTTVRQVKYIVYILGQQTLKQLLVGMSAAPYLKGGWLWCTSLVKVLMQCTPLFWEEGCMKFLFPPRIITWLALRFLQF